MLPAVLQCSRHPPRSISTLTATVVRRHCALYTCRRKGGANVSEVCWVGYFQEPRRPHCGTSSTWPTRGSVCEPLHPLAPAPHAAGLRTQPYDPRPMTWLMLSSCHLIFQMLGSPASTLALLDALPMHWLEPPASSGAAVCCVARMDEILPSMASLSSMPQALQRRRDAHMVGPHPGAALSDRCKKATIGTTALTVCSLWQCSTHPPEPVALDVMPLAGRDWSVSSIGDPGGSRPELDSVEPSHSLLPANFSVAPLLGRCRGSAAPPAGEALCLRRRMHTVNRPRRTRKTAWQRSGAASYCR